jgi:hypothetical protein
MGQGRKPELWFTPSFRCYSFESCFRERVKLHEGDVITFGVAQREIRDRVDVPGEGANRDVMGKEVGAHPAKVGCGKRDFEKKV